MSDRCPQCHAPLVQGDAFCPACGMRIPVPGPPAGSTRFCTACNTPLLAGDQFCPICGQTCQRPNTTAGFSAAPPGSPASPQPGYASPHIPTSVPRRSAKSNTQVLGKSKSNPVWPFVVGGPLVLGMVLLIFLLGSAHRLGESYVAVPPPIEPQAPSSQAYDPAPQSYTPQQMTAQAAPNGITSQTAQPDEDVRLQALAAAGVPATQQNQVLCRCEEIASEGYTSSDKVLNTLIAVIHNRPGQIAKAVDVVETIGRYQAQYPYMQFFDSAIEISTSPNPDGIINGIRAQMLGLSGDDSTVLTSALRSVAP